MRAVAVGEVRCEAVVLVMLVLVLVLRKKRRNRIRSVGETRPAKFADSLESSAGQSSFDGLDPHWAMLMELNEILMEAA